MKRRGLLGGVLCAVIALAVWFIHAWIWEPARYWRDAEAAYARGDFAAAGSLLEQYLRVRPGSAEAHLLAARSARRAARLVLPSAADVFGTAAAAAAPPAGSFEKARKHLDAFAQHGGLPEVVRLEEYLIRAQRGDPDPVVNDLRARARQDVPEAPLIWEALAHGYMRFNRLPEARTCLNAWLGRQETAEAYFWRGWIHERLQSLDMAAAVEDYRRAVELDPTRDDARLRLVNLLLTVQQTDEAFGHLHQLRERQPDNPGVRLGLALYYHAKGQNEEAARLLDDLTGRTGRTGTDSHRASHSRVPVLIARARVALRERQLDVAEERLRQALALDPSGREANYLMAQCLRQGGRKAEAEAYLAKLDRIDADIKRLSEVIPQVAKQPRDPGLCCEVGMIFLRNGYDAEGLRWLGSALRKESRHAPTHRLLADYYGRNGDAAKADYHRRMAQPPR